MERIAGGRGMAGGSVSLGLTLVALLDAAALYARLIRRRAFHRRDTQEHEAAALRSLVRIMLVDQQPDARAR
jgi:hypothetical protein